MPVLLKSKAHGVLTSRYLPSLYAQVDALHLLAQVYHGLLVGGRLAFALLDWVAFLVSALLPVH